jgi:hypothetical protein
LFFERGPPATVILSVNQQDCNALAGRENAHQQNLLPPLPMTTDNAAMFAAVLGPFETAT